jgi:hypothetical protein
MILASSPLEWREKELGSDQNARRAKFLSAMHCKERPICRKCFREEKDGGLGAMQSFSKRQGWGKRLEISCWTSRKTNVATLIKINLVHVAALLFLLPCYVIPKHT